MIKIKDLIEKMDGELDASQDYAETALRYKTEDKELADLYVLLAGEELEHYNKLHTQVVRIIDKYRIEKGEPPAEMKAIWDWEHKKEVERVAEIKVIIDMIKR